MTHAFFGGPSSRVKLQMKQRWEKAHPSPIWGEGKWILTYNEKQYDSGSSTPRSDENRTIVFDNFMLSNNVFSRTEYQSTDIFDRLSYNGKLYRNVFNQLAPTADLTVNLKSSNQTLTDQTVTAGDGSTYVYSNMTLTWEDDLAKPSFIRGTWQLTSSDFKSKPTDAEYQTYSVDVTGVNDAAAKCIRFEIPNKNIVVYAAYESQAYCPDYIYPGTTEHYSLDRGQLYVFNVTTQSIANAGSFNKTSTQNISTNYGTMTLTWTA